MNKPCFGLAILFVVSQLITTTVFAAQFASTLGSKSTDSTLSYNKELDGFDYPFNVNTYSFTSQNQTLNMRYMDVGDQASTKVIVLLHGKNFSGFYWEQTARLLMDEGYRVIIPDQVGFGKSTKPEHYQYSFAQLALNTQSLLKSLKINHYTVVGHSMGGMLATTMALNYAQSIEKLILINPIGLEPYLDYVEIKDPQFFYEKELKSTPEKIRSYQKQNYYAGKWTEVYEHLIAPHIGWLNGPDKKVVAWNNALTYMPIFAEDITTKFSKISVPTSLIIGTRDRTGPGRGWKKSGVDYKLGQYQYLGKRAADIIPNADLYLMEGLGHLPQIENFERFKPVFIKALK
jgi:pimeloyl-ACP methyl ester carboxylesterase